MRLPWSKKEVYIVEQPKRKEPTIRDYSKKVVLKKMRKSEEFGTEVAMKELGYSEPGTKGIKEYVSELKTVSSFIKELQGEEGDKGGGEAGMIGQILNSKVAMMLAQPIVAMLNKAKEQPQIPIPPPGMCYLISPDGSVQQMPIQPEQLTDEQAKRLPPPEEPAPKKKLKKSKEPAPEEGISLTELEQQFGNEPAQVVEELKESHPGWLALLKTLTYDGLMKQVEPFKEDPILNAIIIELSLPDKKAWIEEIIRLAKEH